MPRLIISALGRVAVRLDGALVPLPKKALALLVHLAAEAHCAHHRRTLAALLWPEAAEERALHNLRQALSSLRQALGLDGQGAPFLRIGRETVAFQRASDHRLDIAAFAAPTACPAEENGRTACRAHCERVLELHAGPFLQDLSLAESEAFEQWVLVRREAVERLAGEMLDRLVECYRTAGEATAMESALRRRIALEPWDETAHRALIAHLAESGREAEAIGHCRSLTERLDRELGITPGPETLALCGGIRGRRAGRRQSLLVVDGDGAVRATLAAFLRRNGWLVETAAGIEECRLQLRRRSFDAVLLETALPDGDGFALARELRHGCDVPLVFISRRRGPRDRVAGLDLGADDYMCKPLHLPEVAARLRNLLRRRWGAALTLA